MAYLNRTTKQWQEIGSYYYETAFKVRLVKHIQYTIHFNGNAGITANHGSYLCCNGYGCARW